MSPVWSCPRVHRSRPTRLGLGARLHRLVFGQRPCAPPRVADFGGAVAVIAASVLIVESSARVGASARPPPHGVPGGSHRPAGPGPGDRGPSRRRPATTVPAPHHGPRPTTTTLRAAAPPPRRPRHSGPARGGGADAGRYPWQSIPATPSSSSPSRTPLRRLLRQHHLHLGQPGGPRCCTCTRARRCSGWRDHRLRDRSRGGRLRVEPQGARPRSRTSRHPPASWAPDCDCAEQGFSPAGMPRHSRTTGRPVSATGAPSPRAHRAELGGDRAVAESDHPLMGAAPVPLVVLMASPSPTAVAAVAGTGSDRS